MLLRWIQALHEDATEALNRALVDKLAVQYWSHTEFGITIPIPLHGVVPLRVASRAASEGTTRRLLRFLRLAMPSFPRVLLTIASDAIRST